MFLKVQWSELHFPSTNCITKCNSDMPYQGERLLHRFNVFVQTKKDLISHCFPPLSYCCYMYLLHCSECNQSYTPSQLQLLFDAANSITHVARIHDSTPTISHAVFPPLLQSQLLNVTHLNSQLESQL